MSVVVKVFVTLPMRCCRSIDMRVDCELFALPNASDHDPAGVVT
jgi:hypothetical protein